MLFSRWQLLFAIVFLLVCSSSSYATVNKPSKSLHGTWHSAKGTLTFHANGTIIYRGKRYYYAVNNGGIIQLKGRHTEKTITYQLAGGKLTLTEGGKPTVYTRRR